jgi:uncharacterized protein YdaU (DUF1376 family)
VNHYPHHLGDYAKDTLSFSALEHGVYRLLMDAYYATEEAPAEDEVHAIAKANTPSERKAVDKVLRKFELREGRYYHKRIEEEIAAYRVRAETARTNGKLGGRRQPTGNPVGYQSGNQGGNLASSHKPVTSKPQNLSPEEASSSDSSERPAVLTTAARASPPSSSFPKPDDARVVALHGIACASGVRLSLLDCQQWVSEGLTDAQLLDAISRARAKKPGAVIPIAFLQCFVGDVRNAAPYDAKGVIERAAARIAAKEAANAAH